MGLSYSYPTVSLFYSLNHGTMELSYSHLVEMPAILDNLFQKLINTTNSPIEVEGGRKATKWQDLRTQPFYGQIMMASISGCFQLHMSQNVATSMCNLTSQSFVDSLPAVCLAGKVWAIYRSAEHPWTPDCRPVNEASVKAVRWGFGNGTNINCCSLLLYLSNGREKWYLKLYVYKT